MVPEPMGIIVNKRFKYPWQPYETFNPSMQEESEEEGGLMQLSAGHISQVAIRSL